MANSEKISLCRICLEDGATCPIFKEIEKDKSIHSILSECLKEKIEDINGYPKSICLSCLKTLNIVFEFINKFKKSHKILEGGLLNLKLESDNDQSDIESDNNLAEIEIDLKRIKSEPDILLETLEDSEQLIELLEPNIKETCIKNESLGRKKKVLTKSSKKYSNRTNRIATSILEGEFAWTGETWGLKSTELRIQNTAKGQRRDTRLKLPKKIKDKQPKLCDICGDIFMTQYKLNLHRQKTHFKKPVRCPECSRMYNSEYNLKCHMKRRHCKNKEFMCSSCGGAFAFRGELTTHINVVHKRIKIKKTYSCKFCSKTYKSPKSVVIHERSAHTGERPAECSVCFKGFYHEDYLKEHMRLHTGEAPFKCPVCGRGYAQRGNMKSHLRIHRISEIDSIILSKMRPNYLKLLKV